MVGAAPTIGGGLFQAGAGGGFRDPATDSTDPAGSPSPCGGNGGGPGPGSGGSGGGPGGGGCSGDYGGGSGGGSWGGGGSNDGAGDVVDMAFLSQGMPSAATCGNGPTTCGNSNGAMPLGLGGAGGGSGLSGTYGSAGNGRITFTAPSNNVYARQYVVLDDSSTPCDPPPGGPVPVPVSGSSSPHSCNLVVVGDHFENIGGAKIELSGERSYNVVFM